MSLRDVDFFELCPKRLAILPGHIRVQSHSWFQ
jgi:hypothetical protein